MKTKSNSRKRTSKPFAQGDIALNPEVYFTDTLSVMKSSLYQKSQLLPYNPDDLVQKFGASGQGLDKYEKMLRDDAVKAALITKKSAIIASGWSIQAGEETPEAIDIAKWVEINFRDKFEGSFDASLYEILDAFDYGFTVTEKVYEIIDGSMILKFLKTRPSQSFEFHQDDKGYLLPDGVKQWTRNSLISIPTEKIIIYSYDKKRDNYYGNSDLSAAYRAWFSKDFTIKMMNIAIERMGNPLIVMKYPKNASPEERTDMQSIINNISAKTSVLFPQEADIEIIQAQSNMDLFQKAIDIYNLSIMKAILLPEKMGFGGDTGGSYALGKVQQDTYLWILTKIRNEIEILINECLIRQLVDYNFGEQEKYPKFVFKPLSEENKDEKAKIVIDALARGGVLNDLETENYLRGLLGLPEKEEEEENDEDTSISDNEQSKKQKSKPNNKSTKDNDGGDEDGDEKNMQLKREFKLRRKLNDYEYKVDFEKINKDLEDNTAESIESLQDILVKMRDDYTNQILRKKILENKDISLAKTLEFKYIRDYALECEAFLRKAFNQGRGTAKDTYKKAKKTFAKPTTNIGLVKSKALMYIKEKAKLLTGEISDKLQNKVRAIVADGVLNGDPINIVAERVDEAFAKYVAKTGSEGYDYDGGSLYTPVNTEIARAYSAGMSEFNRDLEASGEIVAYEWSSVIDMITTEGCRELDGIIYEVTNDVWNKLHQPRHWNCRSLMVPIFRDEEYIADADIGIYDEF